MGRHTLAKSRLAPVMHGHARRGRRSPLYRCWSSMMKRCYNENYIGFSRYGGRGIEVYEEWHVFEKWLADMGPSYFEYACQDRINPDGNYEPGNVQWLTRSENSKKMFSDRTVYEDVEEEKNHAD